MALGVFLDFVDFLLHWLDSIGRFLGFSSFSTPFIKIIGVDFSKIAKKHLMLLHQWSENSGKSSKTPKVNFTRYMQKKNPNHRNKKWEFLYFKSPGGCVRPQFSDTPRPGFFIWIYRFYYASTNVVADISYKQSLPNLITGFLITFPIITNTFSYKFDCFISPINSIDLFL